MSVIKGVTHTRDDLILNRIAETFETGLLDRLEHMTRAEFWRFALTCLAAFWTCVAAAVFIPLLIG